MRRKFNIPTSYDVASRAGVSQAVVSRAFQPGAPISTLVGGRWNGLPVISKSGAFGTPDFLENLIGSLESDRKARP